MGFSYGKITIVLVDTSEVLVHKWGELTSKMCASSWFGVPVSVVPTLGKIGDVRRPASGPPTDFDNVSAVVSPANSFGWMRGGVDAAIAELFGAEAVVEKDLRRKWKGYLPLGNSNIVRFDSDEFYESALAWKHLKANSIIQVTTMRVPEVVYDPEREEALKRQVFDWTWSVLSAVNMANEETLRTSEGQFIDTVVMSGLGTGWGGLPAPLVGEWMMRAIILYTAPTVNIQRDIIRTLDLDDTYLSI